MFGAHLRGRAAAILTSTLLAAAGTLWSAPSLAASGCLTGGATNKLCLSLNSVPGDSVQPSQLAGTPTYVKYTAVLSNTVLATSRYITVTFDLAPASGFVSIDAEDGMACTLSGSHVSCFVDKLERIDPQTITLVAEAPRVPTTATELVNTAVFGFQGNTATVTKTVAVSEESGSSHVPAGEEVTIVSKKEQPNPEDQVSPEDPLWAKVTLPPQPVDYYASINIITDGPRIANCVNGAYVSAFDGGPYLCRDHLSPGRWAQFDVGTTEGSLDPVLFTANNPMEVTMMWDGSIIPAGQQGPSDLFPTGFPQFAVFYAQPEPNPYPATVNARAFADVCGSPGSTPPCLNSVERFSNGDWRATGLKQTDESDIPTPIDQLLSMLDILVGTADAGNIRPPINL